MEEIKKKREKRERDCVCVSEKKTFNSSKSLMANSIMSMLGKMLLIPFQNQ